MGWIKHICDDTIRFYISYDEDQFRDWCDEVGGSIISRDDSVVCEHEDTDNPVGTREYRDKVIFRDNGRTSEVSIPGEWSGWHSGVHEVNKRGDDLILEGRETGMIRSARGGFEYFYHEDDDVAPELEEMHDSFRH
jgi:hypothetical protein